MSGIDGLDLEQLRLLIVRPTLEHLKLWSRPAEDLVLGTALVESRLKYVKQLGNGPARGLWQMESATHDDIWRNYLSAPRNFELRERLSALEAFPYGAEQMTGNLYYGAAMCRVHYLRVPAALPTDADGMAHYWKRYYNTPLGAGTVAKALPLFRLVTES